MTQEKTHWKKHLDTKYISGEDLQSSLNGLKPEMVVMIDKFEDSTTFDQQKQANVLKTGLFLKELSGKAVYKPVILNTVNAKFFSKECGSNEVDDWVGHPVILYALKDSRHGYVARFKKFIMPTLNKDTKEFTNCYTAIHTQGYTMDQIRKRFQVSSEVEKLLMTAPVKTSEATTTKPKKDA